MSEMVCTQCGETNHSEFVIRYWEGLCARCDEIANPPECWDEKCQKRHADAADEIQRLQAEVGRLREVNESVAVCSKHVSEVTKGACLVCECEDANARTEETEACLSEIRALPRFRMYVLVDGDCPPSGANLRELTGVRWSELREILEKHDA